MVATSPRARVEEIAHDLFDFVKHLWLAAPRGRRQDRDLKEMEFLTLTLLDERGTMIVGDIQRILGVLPAQMSRIIRALEDSRPEPLIACRINPRDKRKIDVNLTGAGEKALTDYRSVRVRRIAEVLGDLPEDEQADLLRLLDKVRSRLEVTVPG
jgi:DNA-binding MarR family transcriptional regulator